MSDSAASSAPCGRSGLQGTGPIQSLTTKRGGQSRRRPSLWACSNASVQSWKKWLRSLNPKSRTIRSNVSRCSRRTLVVRLPCEFWVNSVSVFIMDDSVGSFNGHICIKAQCNPCRRITLDLFHQRTYRAFPDLDAKDCALFERNRSQAPPIRIFAN